MPLQDANATLSFGGFRLRERSDDPVLVVKGEKTSDAVRALIPSYSPITSMGEGAAPERLGGPDGRRYARGDAALVHKAGAPRVRIVQLAEGMPAHWDWPIPFPGV